MKGKSADVLCRLLIVKRKGRNFSFILFFFFKLSNLHPSLIAQKQKKSLTLVIILARWISYRLHTFYCGQIFDVCITYLLFIIMQPHYVSIIQFETSSAPINHQYKAIQSLLKKHFSFLFFSIFFCSTFLIASHTLFELCTNDLFI